MANSIIFRRYFILLPSALKRLQEQSVWFVGFVFFLLWYRSAALDKALITELAIQQDPDLTVWHSTSVCAVCGAL